MAEQNWKKSLILASRRRGRDKQANTFRDNLRRLAIKMECADENALAKRLGWIREKKKWLRRLWNDGLQRPNSKTAEDLTKLARFFGFNDFGPLWEKDVKLPISPRGITEFLSLLRTWDANVSEYAVRHLDHMHPDSKQTNREILQQQLINNTPESLAENYYRHYTGQNPPSPKQTAEIVKDIENSMNQLSEQILLLIDEQRQALMARIASRYFQ